jgi:hypothetical protein
VIARFGANSHVTERIFRSMHDADGPEVANIFYEALLAHDVLDADTIPYALDEAVCTLRKRKVPSARWAAFVHIGA